MSKGNRRKTHFMHWKFYNHHFKTVHCFSLCWWNCLTCLVNFLQIILKCYPAGKSSSYALLVLCKSCQYLISTNKNVSVKELSLNKIKKIEEKKTSPGRLPLSVSALQQQSDQQPLPSAKHIYYIPELQNVRCMGDISISHNLTNILCHL